MASQDGYYRYQLTVDKILDSGEQSYPTREIVYRDLRRYTRHEFADSVKRLVTGLKKLGISSGERVGVIDWDTDVYLHMYYAVPMLGATLHTVNIRYPPEIILRTILQAQDKWLLVRDEFLPIIERAKEFFRGIRFIVYSDSKDPVRTPLDAVQFWDLLQNEPSQLGELDENTTATIFFTSGTTGNPKGVSFTHRDLFLHAMSTALVGSAPPLSLTTNDVYMILVPMFHVHAWGYPYIFMLSGAKYVLPGKYDYSLTLRLLEKEGVTFSAMVPTILHLILSQPDAGKYIEQFKKWRVTIGGSALPEGLAKTAVKYGITVIGGYGLSETCPVLSVGYYNSFLESVEEQTRFREQISAGAPIPLVKLRIVDEAGKDVPAGTIGEIVARAPWLTREYYMDPEKTRALWRGGWLHTGDLGYFDKFGYLHIVDREKDAIKSGGEFIPSILLEDAISLHPKVGQVAVVGEPDEKWGERPVAFVVAKESMGEEEIRTFLMGLVNEGKIQKWWIPDKFIFVDSLPLTSTNKVDKKILRDKLSQSRAH
ncbi:MAG: long-chain-fatty-acid--CoA ligase [Thermoprotei archaeon]